MPPATDDFRTLYLRDILKRYSDTKALADRAIAQVANADLHRTFDSDSNSISIVVKHLSGNLRSRFSDFLTTDGEKPHRDRDAEFELDAPPPRDVLLAEWEAAWAIALTSIGALAPSDLDRTITIAGQPHLVVEALNRLVTHAAYHVGQIVFLAKHFAGPDWTTLTIPKKRR